MGVNCHSLWEKSSLFLSNFLDLTRKGVPFNFKQNNLKSEKFLRDMLSTELFSIIPSLQLENANDVIEVMWNIKEISLL